MVQNNMPMGYGASPYSPYSQPAAPQSFIGSRQTSAPILKGRLVSSIEEARAQSIDFDGSIFYFPDLANSRIYTKQINPDGTSALNMYELKEMPKTPNGNDYITRQEFEMAMQSISTALQGKKEERAAPSVPDPEISYKF